MVYKLRNTLPQGYELIYYLGSAGSEVEFSHVILSMQVFEFEADRLSPSAETAIANGSLKPGITDGPDSPAASFRAGHPMVYRHLWSAVTVYKPGDIVKSQGILWVCVSKAYGQSPVDGSAVWLRFVQEFPELQDEITAFQAALAAQWVSWPLSGTDDPRGGLGADTYDADNVTFWKKVSLSPHLWVQLSGSGGGESTVSGQVLIDGVPATIDGVSAAMTNEASSSSNQVTEGGQNVTEGGQNVTEGSNETPPSNQVTENGQNVTENGQNVTEGGN